MSKVFIAKVYKERGQRVIIYSDGHSNVCAFFEGDPEPTPGDEVVCPTCADLIEKDNEIQSLKDKLQRAEGKIEEMVEFQKKYMSFDLSKGDCE